MGTYLEFWLGRNKTTSGGSRFTVRNLLIFRCLAVVSGLSGFEYEGMFQIHAANDIPKDVVNDISLFYADYENFVFIHDRDTNTFAVRARAL